MRVLISMLAALVYSIVGGTFLHELERVIKWKWWIEGPLMTLLALILLGLCVNTMVYPGRYVPGLSESSTYSD